MTWPPIDRPAIAPFPNPAPWHRAPLSKSPTCLNSGLRVVKPSPTPPSNSGPSNTLSRPWPSAIPTSPGKQPTAIGLGSACDRAPRPRIFCPNCSSRFSRPICNFSPWLSSPQRLRSRPMLLQRRTPQRWPCLQRPYRRLSPRPYRRLSPRPYPRPSPRLYPRLYPRPSS